MSYECMSTTYLLSLDSHWSILQTPSVIYHSTIFQENNNNFESTSTVAFGSVNRIHNQEVDLLDFK